MARLITPREAADLVQDGAVLALGGFGAYCGPDALLDALASRFQESRHPAGLTVVTGISTGDNTQNDVGMNRIASLTPSSPATWPIPPRSAPWRRPISWRPIPCPWAW